MSENKKHPNAEWIIAFAEGKQLQFFGSLSETWMDFQGEHDAAPHVGPWNSAPNIKWRIKPERPWVRVAGLLNMNGDVIPYSVHSEGMDEERWEGMTAFSHWLSDRLYYTPKERP